MGDVIPMRGRGARGYGKTREVAVVVMGYTKLSLAGVMLLLQAGWTYMEVPTGDGEVEMRFVKRKAKA